MKRGAFFGDGFEGYIQRGTERLCGTGKFAGRCAEIPEMVRLAWMWHAICL